MAATQGLLISITFVHDETLDTAARHPLQVSSLAVTFTAAQELAIFDLWSVRLPSDRMLGAGTP